MVQKNFKLFAAVLSILFFTATVFAQQVQNKKTAANISSIEGKNYTEKQFDNFIRNLEVAIQAENTGLRRSAVYLAGLYSLNEVVPVLIKQLEKENDDNIKILIALALYRIEDPAGIEAVDKLYNSESSGRVKRMSKAIVDNFRNKFAQLEISER